MGKANPARRPGHEAPRRVASDRLRWRVLRQLERHLELPVACLGLAWLALFAVEMVRGANGLMTAASTAIWIIFIIDFAIRLVLAPQRIAYLRRNWLTALSLLVPALRAFRIVRAVRLLAAARAGRGLRLIRAVTSLNRGMGALGAALRRRGIAYIVLLAVVVTLAGAAGMYALEPHGQGATGFSSYADALWWTAMIVTTFGSQYWPQTGEGRILALLLSLFAVSVFGYLTATLASFFVGRDAVSKDAEIAGAADVQAMRREMSALRDSVRTLAAAIDRRSGDSG